MNYTKTTYRFFAQKFFTPKGAVAVLLPALLTSPSVNMNRYFN